MSWLTIKFKNILRQKFLIDNHQSLYRSIPALFDYSSTLTKWRGGRRSSPTNSIIHIKYYAPAWTYSSIWISYSFFISTNFKFKLLNYSPSSHVSWAPSGINSIYNHVHTLSCHSTSGRNRVLFLKAYTRWMMSVRWFGRPPRNAIKGISYLVPYSRKPPLTQIWQNETAPTMLRIHKIGLWSTSGWSRLFVQAWPLTCTSNCFSDCINLIQL